jgi:hypothetical protein
MTYRKQTISTVKLLLPQGVGHDNILETPRIPGIGKMKIKTDLKAGNFIQDVSSTVNGLWRQTGAFVDRASQDASKLTHSTVVTTTTLINCLANSFYRS